MDKCVACQYYDRQHAKTSEGNGVMWGQCRRTAPMLNPINAKSYMIEGVWPHVRDDDWCGEWKQTSRRAETRLPETASPGVHVAIVTNVPGVTGPTVLPPRPAGATVLQVAPVGAAGIAHSVSIGNAAFGATLSGTATTAAGRGD